MLFVRLPSSLTAIRSVFLVMPAHEWIGSYQYFIRSSFFHVTGSHCMQENGLSHCLHEGQRAAGTRRTCLGSLWPGNMCYNHNAPQFHRLTRSGEDCIIRFSDMKTRFTIYLHTWKEWGGLPDDRISESLYCNYARYGLHILLISPTNIDRQLSQGQQQGSSLRRQSTVHHYSDAHETTCAKENCKRSVGLTSGSKTGVLAVQEHVIWLTGTKLINLMG